MPYDEDRVDPSESFSEPYKPPPRASYTSSLAAIPGELKEGKVFSPVWIEKRADGKLEKVPFNAKTGSPYKRGTMPENLVSFEEALVACEKHDDRGVERRFTENDDIGFIDIDNCFSSETGEPSAWALEVLEVANSYAERSVSGKGLHIVGRFKKPHGPNKLLGGRVEVYDSDQFMVLTGELIGGAPAELNDIQRVVDEFYKHHRALYGDFEDTDVVPGASGPGNDLTDEEVLIRARDAKNGERFCQLFNEGDTSSNHGDNSAADLALAGYLAFWAGGEREQIDRLFRVAARRYRVDRGGISSGAVALGVALATSLIPPLLPISKPTTHRVGLVASF